MSISFLYLGYLSLAFKIKCAHIRRSKKKSWIMSYNVHTAIVVSFVYGPLLRLDTRVREDSRVYFLILPLHLSAHYSKGIFMPTLHYYQGTSVEGGGGEQGWWNHTIQETSITHGHM